MLSTVSAATIHSDGHLKLCDLSYHVENIKIVVTNKPWQQNLIVVPVHEMSVDNSGQ